MSNDDWRCPGCGAVNAGNDAACHACGGRPSTGDGGTPAFAETAAPTAAAATTEPAAADAPAAATRQPARDAAPSARRPPARFREMTLPARAALVALRAVELGCCVLAWMRPSLAAFLQLLAILAIAWVVQHRLRTWPAARRADADGVAR